MEKNISIQDIKQTVCRECYKEIWHKYYEDDYLYCHECGAKLNEQSHGDASEGSFVYENS